MFWMRRLNSDFPVKVKSKLKHFILASIVLVMNLNLNVALNTVTLLVVLMTRWSFLTSQSYSVENLNGGFYKTSKTLTSGMKKIPL